ncbi:MAG: diguanylate cyclase [Pseudazoarcus pumilus]|nr:diguanylate cyclase [Pseudazoarcus pumilus]
MTEDPSQKLAAQLEALRRDYAARLPGEMATLQALGERLCGMQPDAADLDELHHRLHKLAGSGGTFGFAALSAAARALELQIKYWREVGPATIDAATRQAFSSALAAFCRNHLDLPLPASQSSAPARPSAVGTAQTSWNVWLIEDDELCGRDLSQQIESFNFSVRHFTRLADAEQAAQEACPDLLIADIVLDAKNDSTLALKTCPNLSSCGCPLIFITSHDDFASRVRAVRMGASAYSLKPLDIPRLIRRMTQLLEARQAPPERVLIVEDDLPLAEHYRLVLQAAGVEAHCLGKPEELIESIASLRPELILMDMHMPRYSGAELAGVVRQHDNWASLPIVYLSAETDLNQQVSAMRHGADDFLTKPISDAQLVATVRSRVERARVLEGLISLDSLTGLLKHSAIKEAAARMLARARRSGSPVTVVMLDIDHFKRVNDSYGHATGDVVISSLATLLRQRLRTSDVVGRYGGEEFLVVLPECTAEHARKLMDDILESFSRLHFSHAQAPFTCTLTAGLASSADHPALDSEGLIEAADRALYEGKHGGRNQVRVAAASVACH